MTPESPGQPERPHNEPRNRHEKSKKEEEKKSEKGEKTRGEKSWDEKWRRKPSTPFVGQRSSSGQALSGSLALPASDLSTSPGGVRGRLSWPVLV